MNYSIPAMSYSPVWLHDYCRYQTSTRVNPEKSVHPVCQQQQWSTLSIWTPLLNLTQACTSYVNAVILKPIFARQHHNVEEPFLVLYNKTAIVCAQPHMHTQTQYGSWISFRFSTYKYWAACQSGLSNRNPHLRPAVSRCLARVHLYHWASVAAVHCSHPTHVSERCHLALLRGRLQYEQAPQAYALTSLIDTCYR